MSPSVHPTYRPPRVTFHGAARTVTGSMHLVEAGGQRILLDCGVVQGGRDPVRERGTFPFAPASLNAVVLSHAHTDHCGNLPALVRQGFAGPIYCTPATKALVAVMLADSARIHDENAHVEQVIAGPDRPLGRQTVTRADVTRTIQHCVAVDYGTPHRIGDTVEVRFADAGHILGSAMAHLAVSDPSGDYRLTFTGDLGRRGLPYLRDAAGVPACDFLICESTYGGRRHDTRDQMAAKMAAVVHRTADRGGKVLIPAFSLGRTQLVLFYLRRWMALGKLPRLPLYADSPLAMMIGQVYGQHPEAFQVAPSPDDPPVHFVASADESQELTQRKGPAVIVASGGMCEGGRIVGHLKEHLNDPRATIVLVSYQAPGTVGTRLLERKPTVRFHGRNWNKWAEVVELNGFSGHADHDDLTAYLDPLAGSTRQVRLVHGELHAAEALAESLVSHGFDDVAVPAQGQTVELVR